MNLITIALPEVLREAGNQYARCIGMGPEDDQTFAHEANALDANGNRYIVTSGWVVPHFSEIALGALSEPEWGCDLDAARTIPALIRVGEAAAPDLVAAVFDLGVDEALEIMGLTRIIDSNDD